MPTKRPAPQTPAAPQTAAAANIANIERMIAAQAPDLAKKAPKQLQDMKTLLRELKAGRPPTETSQQMMRSLVIWQLDAKRDDYVARLAAMPTSPETAKARRALDNMVRVLDEAKKAMSAPNPQAMRAVEMATSRAKVSLEAAMAEEQAPEADPEATPPPLPEQAAAPAPKKTRAPPLPDPDATPPPASKVAKPTTKPAPLTTFRAPPQGTALNSPAWLAARSEAKKPKK